MKHWKLWIGLSLVFILGGVTGALVTGYVLRNHEHGFSHNPAKRTAFIVDRLTRKLDLSDTQKAEVEKIVQKTEEKSHARFLSHREEMRTIRNEGIEEIRKGLTPDQQEKMEQIRREFERKREKEKTR